MTFEELWKQVDELHILPDTAIAQIPGILSSATKKKLSQMTVEDAGETVSAAINEINHGSIEPLDELIQKRL